MRAEVIHLEEEDSSGRGRKPHIQNFNYWLDIRNLAPAIRKIPTLHLHFDGWDVQIQLITLSLESLSTPLHHRHLQSEELNCLHPWDLQKIYTIGGIAFKVIEVYRNESREGLKYRTSTLIIALHPYCNHNLPSVPLH